MTPAELCDAAANRLETRGWTRGRPFNDRGGACLVAALVEAKNDGQRPMSVDLVVFDRVMDALREELFGSPNGGNVAHWNDEQRDKRKVIRLLRHTARKLRQ